MKRCSLYYRTGVVRIALSLVSLWAGACYAQPMNAGKADSDTTGSLPAYFIDGYHGGIYGHLPLWQTKFMVEKLRQYPDWKINLELEPESWDSIALQDPAALGDFQQLVADQSSKGRVEYVNPAYGQSYMYTITGESVIRQFYYGMKKLRRYFPKMVFTTYSSEEPCFTSALPQILRSYGFKYASLKNPNTCWGGYTRAYGGELVNWIGPDGSSLLTVPRYAVEGLKPRSIWETMAASNSTGYILKAVNYGIRHPVGMCLQDAGWAAGPWLGKPETIGRHATVGTCETIGTDTTVGRHATTGRHATVDGSAAVDRKEAVGMKKMVGGSEMVGMKETVGTRATVDRSGAVDRRRTAGKNEIIDRYEIDSNKTYVPTVYETWRGYIENRTDRKADRDWRLSQEDVLVSLMWGAQVLQRIAREVRLSENTIIMSEKLASLARVYGGRAWPGESLDEAWRTLLLSQHHDCWIVPYNGKQGDTWADKVVKWTGNTNDRSAEILEGSMAALAGGVGAGGDVQMIRVFNTLGVRREEVVLVGLPAGWVTAKVLSPDGREIVSQVTEEKKLVFRARVPSVGYSTYLLRKGQYRAGSGTGDFPPGAGDSHYGSHSVQKGARAVRLESGYYEMETDLYRILLDPRKGGVIKSWVAKRLAGKEFVEAKSGRGFNELRGNFYNAGGFRSSTEGPAEIRILENGPVRVNVEIRGQIAGSPFTQVINLEEGQPRVDVHLVIDWKENAAIGEYFEVPRNEEVRKAYYDDRYKLLATFPLALASQKIYKNAAFDVTESHLNNTWFNRWDSIKNNVLLNWVDVEDGAGRYGMALLCDHTTSYVHGQNFPLGLTVQYSGNGIFYRDYKLEGATELRYAWIPHAGKWDRAGIWTEGTKWNEPLLVSVGGTGAVDGKAVKIGDKPMRIENSLLKIGDKAVIRVDSSGSLLQVSGTGIEVSSITCDGDDLLVRLFNAEGESASRKVYLGFAAGGAEEISLDGAGIKGLPIHRDVRGEPWVEIVLPRFGIRTIRFIHARRR